MKKDLKEAVLCLPCAIKTHKLKVSPDELFKSLKEDKDMVLMIRLKDHECKYHHTPVYYAVAKTWCEDIPMEVDITKTIPRLKDRNLQ